MNSKSNVTVVAGVIAVVVFGLIISYNYYKNTDQKPKPGISQENITKQNVTLPSNVPVQLTADEIAILKMPDKNSPKEVIVKYDKLIRQLAKEGNTIEIKAGCIMSPVVLRVKEGQDIIIKNTDSISHEAHFSVAGEGKAENQMRIAPGETMVMKNYKGHGAPSTEAYGCNGGPEHGATSPAGNSNFGILYITN